MALCRTTTSSFVEKNICLAINLSGDFTVDTVTTGFHAKSHAFKKSIEQTRVVKGCKNHIPTLNKNFPDRVSTLD